MNLDSLSFALAEISYSVANLTKKNFRSSVAEINHLVSQHGAEADRHLFRCLFSHVDFNSDGKSAGKDFHQTQFLIQECTTLLSKPNFVSTLCFAVDSPLHQQKTLRPSAHLFPQISKILRLTRVQEVVFGLALLDSSNAEIRAYTNQFVKHKLPDLLRSYIDADSTVRQEGGLQDIAIEVLHLLLAHLVHSKEQFGIGAEQKEAFLKTLRKDFPRDRVPVVIGPLLYPETEDISIDKLTFVTSMQKTHLDASLHDMILESGFSCTSTVEECRNMLIQFGQRDISPSVVARVLGMMAKSPSILPDHPGQSSAAPGSGWGDLDKIDQPGVNIWNVENFIQVVQDLVPNLSWRDVVSELDYPQFVVSNKRGLRLLMKGLIQGLQEIFPVEYICSRTWKNTEGQLSFIMQSLRNPDVFCFADYPCHAVVIDILKTAPDDEKRDIATWKSLELVEVLLRLSEVGHYQQVSELFKFPVQNCPDMLVLALLQITPTWNTLKQELISTLMPLFLGNHPNSAVVLHYAWHCQGHSSTIRTLIMHSMAEWYMRGEPHDQTRLSRILDVAQDLKALSMLLNATPFAFVIDLACLASRREYLKLDKWLNDKIREHREPFIQTCVTFLKRRCPQLVGGYPKDDSQSKSQQLPHETIATMLTCLQVCANNVSKELSEIILRMITNASVILKRQPPVGPKPINPAAPVPQVGPGPTAPVGAGLGGANNSGLSIGPNMGQTNIGSGLGTTSSTQLDPADTLGIPKSWGVPGQVSSGFGGSTNPTPGSPAKGFPTQSTSAFGAIQNMTSQLQNLSIPSSTMAGLGAPRTQQVIKPQVAQVTPQTMQQAQPTAEISNIFPDMNQQFTKEVEDEANSYFQRIYNQPPHPTMSIDEVLEMLKRFKDSANRKEKEVYECMLRNLFEEYQFFPKYPDRELQTTAVLFGGIIEKGLATYMALGIALRYVLEALKKPHGSKMSFFGIAALDRFKTRLKDYPSYCQHLAAIPHFHQFPPHLIEFVEFGSRNQEPPHLSQAVTTRSLTPVTASLNLLGGGGMFGMSSSLTSTSGSSVTSGLESFNLGNLSTMSNLTSTPTTTVTVTTVATSAPATTTAAKTQPITKPSIASATNIDTLLAGQEKEEVVVPSESIQDKVFFIFNNLSMSNMNQKCEELKKEVKDDHMQWVSQYMVMKRSSIEPNFHTLYANFVDALNIKEITDMVILETFRNIKVLMRSDKGDANFSDRTLLKNLGHWLGMLTLAKNKPILQIDIDLKSLVYEAYHKGARELLYVVPFTAKVLESCSKSKVFKPPNPWTMGIMNVLAELHEEPDLKLNLKFEIEVLCKTLNIDLHELKPATYLKDTSKLATLEPQLSINKLIPPPPVQQQQQQQQQQPVSTPQPEPAGIALTNVTPTVTQSITTTTTPGSTPSLPPQPQFAFDDINVTSLAGLAGHIVVNDQIPLLQASPQMKTLVRGNLERVVQELLPPVVERSIKIALITCEQIIRKDFALDPDENRMRIASHHMVRSLTSGLALYTCREPLFISIASTLKTAFLAALGGSTNQQQKELVEQAVQMIAQDNTELASAFIQKTAVERAIPEMDKRLARDFEARKAAREKGIRFCEPVVLTYQAERMPELIRLKVGGETPLQISVYEEFARNIPGFLPLSDPSLPAKPTPSYGTPEDIGHVYEKIGVEIEQHIQHLMNYPSNPRMTMDDPLLVQMRGLMEAIIMARNSRDVPSAVALLQKAVEGLLDNYTMTTVDRGLMMRFRECNLVILKTVQDGRAFGPQWTNRQVTRCLIESREDQRYNIEAVDLLIRSGLVNMVQYDNYLVQLIDNGINMIALTFAVQLIQRYLIDDKANSQVTESDFASTIEALDLINAKSRDAPAGLETLLHHLRQSSFVGDFGMIDRAVGGPSSMMQSGLFQAREIDDPPGLHEKTEYLLRDWVNMYHSPAAGRESTKAFAAFVQQMHHQGILKTDDHITRFFRLCTEMCVDLCYRALSEQTHAFSLIRSKCFHTLDAFVRLIALLVKHSGEESNSVTKINLLNKVLGIVAGVLLSDQEVRHIDFQQLPYHRIFIMLFIELNTVDFIVENLNFQVLTAFCNTFHVLRPAKAPAFAYAWLELVSHRVFIGRMLALTPQQKGWGMYAQLLIDLFTFLTPFLRNAELNKPTRFLYKGTLRVLLVLLHDFPEFLCDYHYAFCDVISPNCVQMRNLILSAFPRNMRLPDPFTPNLKVDMLADIQHPPRILPLFANMIQPPYFKKDLDSYLKTRSPVTFLSDLRSNLQSNEPGTRYNIQLMNALVLYVGTQAIQHIHTKGQTPSMSTIAHSSHMDIFQNLAVDLDSEGRYLFLTAIANQLRYPNSHTHYFSCTLLYLFAEANAEAIQEQITRVLLERLIVNRPHPWGLLITFIELIKNPQFKFWSHEFVHCASEIEKLFESVARSCSMNAKSATPNRDQESAEIH